MRFRLPALHRRCAWFSLLLSCGLPAVADGAGPNPSPLPQGAYVWQRRWDDAVSRSVEEHAPMLHQIVVLNAEVSWVRRQPRLARIPVDYAVLRSARSRVGIALRIGPYPGPFSTKGEPVDSLSALAAALLAEAGSNQLTVSELQIDFDCADSKLAGYLDWVRAIRKRIAPVPLVITALPSWLNQASFKALISASDGYVLQVHSLEKPTGPEHLFSLCDPTSARRAVQQAGRLPVPFRVALPTYGYVVAYDSEGQFAGLAAEATAKSWPAGVRTREIRSNPEELSGLVRLWSTNRPAALRGLIWYRLPVETDSLNWPWQTLAAVMNGREPQARLRGEAQRTAPRLREIVLHNEGEADLPLQVSVLARWDKGHLVSADAMKGFDLVREDRRQVRFVARPQAFPLRLGPGQRRIAGWLRLSEDEDVVLELSGPCVTSLKPDEAGKDAGVPSVGRQQ